MQVSFAWFVLRFSFYFLGLNSYVIVGESCFDLDVKMTFEFYVALNI
jgi:hypothetical protein